MSLINDALKRTQQTTQSQEPPRLDALELHPLETGPHPSQQAGAGAKRIIWIVVLLVVTCNIALWIVFKDRGHQTQVEARTADAELSAYIAPTPEPEPIPVLEPAVPPAPEVPVPAALSNAAAGEVEADASLPAVPAVKRPEFRLKTIVFNPVRPSAMINNRVLFVGDRVEGYTVKGISQDTVWLTRDEDEVAVSLP
ncbi:MAG: hypothetical protein MUC91_05300 [Verrucomicrobia bacterium]|jgi:hypothetical protein|nr:hypothetical protein [Verrucomicrobiota bacterium]